MAPQQRGPDIVVRPVTVAIVGGGEQRVGGARVLTAAPFPGKGQTFEALDWRVTAKKGDPEGAGPVLDAIAYSLPAIVSKEDDKLVPMLVHRRDDADRDQPAAAAPRGRRIEPPQI